MMFAKHTHSSRELFHCFTLRQKPSSKLKFVRTFKTGNAVYLLSQSILKPSNNLSYLNVPGELPLLSKTIGQIVDEAGEKYGDTECLISLEQNVRRTFAQLKQETDDLAAGFLALGLKKGERIGIWGPNSHEWYLTHMAAAKAGLVLVNINPAYQGRELLYALNKVDVKCLVMDDKFKSQNYYEILTSIAPGVKAHDPGKTQDSQVPELRIVISMGSDSSESLKGTYLFQEVLEKGKSHQRDSSNSILQQVKNLVQFDDLFNIQFTSGTTGNPKGVMLSHHNLVNNSFFVGKRFELTPKDKVCVPVPFFHCYGSVAGMLASLHRGVSIVLPAKAYNPKLSMKAVVDEKCTVLYGTPTMHVDFTNVPDIKSLDLSLLRLVVTAGAICPEDLVRTMAQTYGAKVGNCYGLTETSPVFFQSLIQDDDDHRVETIGYPHEHTEVKIVNPEGRTVELGSPGELCARGYVTMLGYWKDPEKTNEALKADTRWFHTGDTFMMLESGHGRIVGRIKEMIIRGGENVYPREIEDFLHSHPKIVEVYVFGVADKRMGEEVACAIRTKDGEQLTETDVKNFCKGQIAHFKIPRYIFFRNDFPKTISGKIQKFRLREETMKLLNLKEL